MQKLLLLALFSTLLFSKKSIVIDLTTQEAFAYEDGNLVMRGEVSTGKTGHRTPTGKFKILQKALKHVSSKYPEPNGGARMDYMMRLTNSGIAMHLGFVPNYPASHGCIRLKNGFAQKLYAWAPVGTEVIIEGKPPIRVSRVNRNVNSSVNTPIVKDSLKIYDKRVIKKRGAKVLVFDDMGNYPRQRASHSSNYYYKKESHQGKLYTRKVLIFDDLHH
jgi:hypothetical protein